MDRSASRRPETWALVVALVAVMGSAAVLARSGEDLPGKSRLRVVTFNVHGASGPRIAESLEDQRELRRADVWMLQEIEVTASSHGPRDLARRLDSEVAYAVSRRHASGTHGIAIVSRRPLSDIEVLPLPRFDLGYRSRHRVALSATTRLGGARLELVNVHLDTRLTLGERREQAAPVLSRAVSAGHAVVGGDFNTIRSVPFFLPWLPLPLPGFGQARSFDAYMREHGLERSLPAVGSTGPLGMELDALYHFGMESLDHGMVRIPELSDHAALWVDLKLSGEARSR